ncbi:MAG: hypothetical protein JHC33_15285, partial [Ignisphaera sp.]|nr:hypothetical protein [Ignisphaera sp.]
DQTTKYLVFQTTTTPGFANNPHLKCEYSGGVWNMVVNTDGINDLNLTDMAYKSDVNVFTSSNTFSSNVTMSGNVVIQSGIIDTTLRAGGTSATITFPSVSGTLALTSDLANYVTLGTSQYITAGKTLDSPNGAILFRGWGSINAAGDGAFATLNVNNIFHVTGSGDVDGLSFSGNHLGSLIGLTLPSAGSDNQYLIKSGSTLIWSTPGSVKVNYILLDDTATTDVYKLQITNGVVTTVLQ